MQSIHNGKDDFLTFEDKDETRLEWLYLELEVIQLLWCLHIDKIYVLEVK